MNELKKQFEKEVKLKKCNGFSSINGFMIPNKHVLKEYTKWLEKKYNGYVVDTNLSIMCLSDQLKHAVKIADEYHYKRKADFKKVLKAIDTICESVCLETDRLKQAVNKIIGE